MTNLLIYLHCTNRATSHYIPTRLSPPPWSPRCHVQQVRVNISVYLLAAEQLPSRTATQRTIRRWMIADGDLCIVVIFCRSSNSANNRRCTNKPHVNF